ncbi:MAG: hypothetical protein GY788_27550 [bacterium]|nr:hypothetical protein [bacterium]
MAIPDGLADNLPEAISLLRHRIEGGRVSRSLRSPEQPSTVVDTGRAASGCSPPDPGDAHGRQGPAHPSLGRRDETGDPGDGQLPAEFKTSQSECCGQ